MITIKGTDKIKGALDLTGINQQLKTGDCIPLTDNDFLDHTVQQAVKMGFITYAKGGILDIGNSSSIKLRNIYDRPIFINALDDEIRPGQTFTISEDQVQSGDIRGALAKGMLEIVASTHASKEKIEELNVRVGDIFKNVEEFPDKPSPQSQKPQYLETNEEALDPGVINVPEPKPIEKDDIPDPKRKTIIWNPTNSPVMHTKTQMEAISLDKAGKSDSIEANVDVSEISFVDNELDQERKKSHPILKDKEEDPDDGIDFL